MAIGAAAIWAVGLAGLCLAMSARPAEEEIRTRTGSWICIPACLDATVLYNSTCSVDFYICTRSAYVINVRCLAHPSMADPVALYESFCDAESAKSTVLEKDISKDPIAVCLVRAKFNNQCVAMLVPASVNNEHDSNRAASIQTPQMSCKLQEIRRSGPAYCSWFLNFAPNGQSSIDHYSSQSAFPHAMMAAVGCLVGVVFALLLLRRHLVKRAQDIQKPDGVAPPGYEEQPDDCVPYNAELTPTCQAQSMRSLPPDYDDMADSLPSHSTTILPIAPSLPESYPIPMGTAAAREDRMQDMAGASSVHSLEDIRLDGLPIPRAAGRATDEHLIQTRTIA